MEKGLKNRFNDAKCDHSGRLWAGTMGPEQPDGSYRPHDGALYSFDGSGDAKMHVPRQGISNGLAWSLDNRTMFFIDSLPRKVYAFDFDITNGSLCKNGL